MNQSGFHGSCHVRSVLNNAHFGCKIFLRWFFHPSSTLAAASSRDVVYSGSWRDFMLETAQLILKSSLFPRFHISKIPSFLRIPWGKHPFWWRFPIGSMYGIPTFPLECGHVSPVGNPMGFAWVFFETDPRYYDAVPHIVQDVMDQVAVITGRHSAVKKASSFGWRRSEN